MKYSIMYCYIFDEKLLGYWSLILKHSHTMYEVVDFNVISAKL